jgi:osmotically inducible lipoprotein OsmB
MFSSRLIALSACAVLLAGCAGLNNTEQRVLTGATIGAGAGAGLGALTAGLSIPAGAAIGAAAGALGGFGVDALSKE